MRRWEAMLGGGDGRTLPDQAFPKLTQGTLTLLLIQGGLAGRQVQAAPRESAVLTWPPGPDATSIFPAGTTGTRAARPGRITRIIHALGDPTRPRPH